jgi:hypothetical protein
VERDLRGFFFVRPNENRSSILLGLQEQMRDAINREAVHHNDVHNMPSYEDFYFIDPMDADDGPLGAFEDVLVNLWGSTQADKRRRKRRSRANRMKIRASKLEHQMPLLTDAFLRFRFVHSGSTSPVTGLPADLDAPPLEYLEHGEQTLVLSEICGLTCKYFIKLSFIIIETYSGKGIRYNYSIRLISSARHPGESIIAHGLISNAPDYPSWAVSIATLQSYQNIRLVKPNFSIQAFVRTMSMNHGRKATSSLINKFSESFHIFLTIKRSIHQKLQQILGRDDPSWRIKHCCPACLHPVPGTDRLKHVIHFSMDGGSSLKRFKRSCSSCQVFESNRIIPRVKVDGWKHVVKRREVSSMQKKQKRKKQSKS